MLCPGISILYSQLLMLWFFLICPSVPELIRIYRLLNFCQLLIGILCFVVSECTFCIALVFTVKKAYICVIWLPVFLI